MPATLIVTVDTEEEFDWSQAGTSREWEVRHVAGLPRFQELCDEFGVRPTYVIDYPIATSAEAMEILGGFRRRSVCEIGAHIHPWVNPPYDEELCPRNTFLSNLPLPLQAEKVAVLTRAIEQAIGARPTTFKAGRYGLDFAFAPRLSELGYTVDTSVIAYTNFAAEGGPDFDRFGPQPFWLVTINGDGTHIDRIHSDGASNDAGERLLEVPCTVGFNRRPFTWWSALHRRLSREWLRPLHPIGILDRTRIMRKIVLSPELAPADDLTTLMQVMSRDPDPVLNVTLHSPSLQAGHTPFVRSPEELERLYASLRQTFEWAARHGARCLTLSEYRDHFKRNSSL